jgi:ArsR family metal-binding transcriptional regulator
MLIESYDLHIDTAKHTAEEFEYEAIARLSVDISAALPYLNAELRNGTYYPDKPAFSWRKDDHSIGFWPDKVAADHLESREQAQEVIESLVRLVNDVWERRGTITPDHGTRENLQPLELYKLVPKTNCRKCGENSCFNFSIKLAAGLVGLAQCEPLTDDPSLEGNRRELEALLKAKRTLL